MQQEISTFHTPSECCFHRLEAFVVEQLRLLLIVDAAQSIQAQTISNLYLALENDLEIIPVLNKVDLPSANPDEVSDDIVDLLGCKKEEIIHASAKTGLGIESVLEAIIRVIPEAKS